jgi:hypothetical protein
MFVENDVEEIDLNVQSPDYNSLEQLWDDLEHQMQARPNHPTSSGNPSQKRRGCYSSKGAPTPY